MIPCGMLRSSCSKATSRRLHNHQAEPLPVKQTCWMIPVLRRARSKSTMLCHRPMFVMVRAVRSPSRSDNNSSEAI